MATIKELESKEAKAAKQKAIARARERGSRYAQERPSAAAPPESRYTRAEQLEHSRLMTPEVERGEVKTKVEGAQERVKEAKQAKRSARREAHAGAAKIHARRVRKVGETIIRSPANVAYFFTGFYPGSGIGPFTERGQEYMGGQGAARKLKREAKTVGPGEYGQTHTEKIKQLKGEVREAKTAQDPYKGDLHEATIKARHKKTPSYFLDPLDEFSDFHQEQEDAERMKLAEELSTTAKKLERGAEGDAAMQKYKTMAGGSGRATK